MVARLGRRLHATQPPPAVNAAVSENHQAFIARFDWRGDRHAAAPKKQHRHVRQDG